MYAGGSGLYLIVHVRLMVLPLSTCKSGPPKIVAVGTEKYRKKNIRQKVICTTHPRIECNRTKGTPKQKRKLIY